MQCRVICVEVCDGNVSIRLGLFPGSFGSFPLGWSWGVGRIVGCMPRNVSRGGQSSLARAMSSPCHLSPSPPVPRESSSPILGVPLDGIYSESRAELQSFSSRLQYSSLFQSSSKKKEKEKNSGTSLVHLEFIFGINSVFAILQDGDPNDYACGDDRRSE